MSKRDKVYIVIISLLLIIFALNEGCHRRSENNLVKDISSYKDSAKSEKLKNGAEIFTNESLKLQTEKQLRAMAESINDTVKQMLKNFKSLSNVTYVTNKFYSGGDTVRYENKIPCDFKPFKVRRGEDTTYKLVATISKDYFSVDSLTIKDNMTLVFGRRKQGFMRYDYAVDINHSNALMKTTNIKDYKYVPEKRWYEKTWVHLCAGALIGVGANKAISSKFGK